MNRSQVVGLAIALVMAVIAFVCPVLSTARDSAGTAKPGSGATLEAAVTAEAPGLGSQALPQADEDLLASIDSEINALSMLVGGFPPRIEGEDEARRVEARLQEVVDVLEDLIQQSEPSAELEWRLGRCYYMQWNLLLPGAWEMAEAHLTKALNLDPEHVDAHLTLGSLYVNSFYAEAAERQFLLALEHSDLPVPSAHEGLFFAYYYQGRFAEAAQQAEVYLAFYPEDEVMREAREIAAERAEGE